MGAAAPGVRADVSVTDDLGRTVALAEPAARVVSLAPHATEQLFAVGAGEQIIAAVNHSDHPPAARDIPRLGDYDAVDLERVMALAPDLVVAWQSGNGTEAIARLRSLDLPVYIGEPRQLGDIPAALARLGILTGHADRGAAAAGRFRARRAHLRTRFGDRPRVGVFYQVWSRPLLTVNGDHLISRVIRLCGGRNVFAGLSTAIPPVSKEAVIAADPEVIVGSGLGRTRPDWLDAWREWPRITAAERGNLFHIPPALITRATPRVLSGAERLCRQLDRARGRRPPSTRE